MGSTEPKRIAVAPGWASAHHGGISVNTGLLFLRRRASDSDTWPLPNRHGRLGQAGHQDDLSEAANMMILLPSEFFSRDTVWLLSLFTSLAIGAGN